MPVSLKVTTLIAAALGADRLDRREIERTFGTLFPRPTYLRALKIKGADDRRSRILIPSSPVATATAVIDLLSTSADTAEIFASLNEVQPSPGSPIDQWHSGTTPAVTSRRWLLFDLDPVRPPSTNSTTEEVMAAASVADRIVEHQDTVGWGEPVVAISGNGIHLLYAVELPEDGYNTVRIQTALSRASSLFGTATVTVDRSVSDAGRLVRLYGTQNRKGPHTEERPRRWSRLLHCPSEIVPVRVHHLHAFQEGATAPRRRDRSLEELRLKRHLTGDELVEFFEGAKPTQGGWMACCPVHADRTPSLSIRDTGDKLLLHCFAGCDTDDILATVGLEYRQLYASDSRSRAPVQPTLPEPPPVNHELEAYAARCRACATMDDLAALARILGLPVWPLLQIGVGWDPALQAWTFPECRFDGGVIGVLLRFPDGRKQCVSRSRRGLTLPPGWQQYRGRVYIPEGASDVAALLFAGLQSIGRPSVDSVADLPRLLASMAIEPVIYRENDQKADGSWPGNDGAQRCARQLAESTGKPVYIQPLPHGVKDVREYVTCVR